jgi:hypothetical protein
LILGDDDKDEVSAASIEDRDSDRLFNPEDTELLLDRLDLEFDLEYVLVLDPSSSSVGGTDNNTFASLLEPDPDPFPTSHPGISVPVVASHETILTPVVAPVLAGMNIVVLPSFLVIAVRCGW